MRQNQIVPSDSSRGLGTFPISTPEPRYNSRVRIRIVAYNYIQLHTKSRPFACRSLSTLPFLSFWRRLYHHFTPLYTINPHMISSIMPKSESSGGLSRLLAILGLLTALLSSVVYLA